MSRVLIDLNHQKTPRLTEMLRSSGTFGDNNIDLPPQTLLAKRRKILANRRHQQPDEHTSNRTHLITLTLSNWETAPKSARDDFDRYISTVSRLLGGQASSEEITASALHIYNIINSIPLATEHDVRHKGPDAYYQAVKSALQREFPSLQLAVVSETLDRWTALQQWRQKLNNNNSTSIGFRPLLSQGGTASSKPEEEFSHPRWTVTSAILATCGLAPTDLGASLLFPSTTLTKQDPNSLERKPHEHRTAGVHKEEEVAAVEEEVFGSKAGGYTAEAGALWLMAWCAKVLGNDGGSNGQGSSASGSFKGQDDTLATAVAQEVLSGKSDDEIAAALFDLLGEGVFDHIASLLSARGSLATNLNAAITRHIDEAETSQQATAGPSYGTGVTVMSESEKAALKAERKAGRKKKSGKNGGIDDESTLDWLAMHGIGVLAAEEEERATAHMKIILGDGIEFRIGEGGGRNSLPKGTIRRTGEGYDEVFVPAVAPAAPPPGENLLEISNLPDWAQKAFEGYKTLNRIQTRIFTTAFTSNENMLVCAPTGAGKTNIAMISVLREVAQHIHDGVIHKNEFKVVYVAPMKALAAEVTANFSRRLKGLGLSVRELTGDMQLSKKEMEETQMIVTTPEKWDVITRKGGEVSVAAAVKLLIIDEVHLLNDERGPVIETLVARTTRQVESSQSMIRIVGLSATLPNYKDVATFLGVNHDTGLFYFDASYRPVPLETQFVGVKDRNVLARLQRMDEVCYQKVVDSLKRGYQAMVFVHSRKDTGKTGRTLAMKAQHNGETGFFDCSEEPTYGLAAKDAKKSRNRELAELFESGIGIHHAGMLRSDRNLVERLFADGLIKVLCCTATLAWGVNLPAHTVIIKGTQLYNPSKGGFTDLGMLDVQQIFGRAGRPQFQDTGEGIIITSYDKLAHYLGMLTHQVPIESQFVEGLADHLNAEIVLGTVTNLREASLWLSYTYLYVRMTQNPLPYGIGWEQLASDPLLDGHRRKLIVDAARELERAKMVRYDERSGNLYVTDLGRVASHFYIKQSSILTFNEMLKPHMTESDLISMIASSAEFENLVVRDEEFTELDELTRRSCPYDVRGGSENKRGKASILLQAYVGKERVDSFSLSADLNYVSQNSPRIARALFEICLRRGWSSAAELCLTMCKSLELRLWPYQHPLRQFDTLKYEVMNKLEERQLDMEQLEDMSAADIGAAIRHPAAGHQIRDCITSFPSLAIEAQLQPVTRTVLRVKLSITPTFKWKDNFHGSALRWLLWVEDSANEHMYHSETWTLTKKAWKEGTQTVAFTVPVHEPMPSQYFVRMTSDSWLGSESLVPLSFKGLILPEKYPPNTELLPLDPLPLSALGNELYAALYRFSHFNPIQTQAFHQLYHTDNNILLGAPTGSGKTISAELTLLHLFNMHPGSKAVYIAPLKALVRERIKDWGRPGGFCDLLGKRLVELTGDYTPDLKALLDADLIVATPEKWDGISRNWKGRAYVRKIGLIIMDEIHLLGADRGPILEVIVSRARYVAAQSGASVRFVGLSTALANAHDLADWLGVPQQGLFNFKPSVRPVPLECHIQGYPGMFYCPRMATMNKPAYAAIQTHSPTKPVLIFVSSRRQTRLTALDLIAYAAQDMRPRTFLHLDDSQLDQILPLVKDSSLRHTLQFGVGLHHAGLGDGDRDLVERLYVEGSIQVLVATSTLAWGVNTPAHLVIIKGTEFFDAPTKRYVDYPITDVLQMMGRAGRPQYDQHGVAVIMVHEPKKAFYKKFLYEPFPVESSLPGQLADHLNAEVVVGSVRSVQDALDYLTWTFFLRRLLQNPSYYGLESTDKEEVSLFLSDLISTTLETLQDAGCLEISQDDQGLITLLTPGRIASFYYLQHATMRIFTDMLRPNLALNQALDVLCAAAEYDELPVRHNEDKLNAVLAEQVRYPPALHTVDDPHTKTSLLLQSHLSRLPLPISDYITDTKSTLDNSLRILQAMIDVAADAGWLATCLTIMKLVQGLMQGAWPDYDPLCTLPHVDTGAAQKIRTKLNIRNDNPSGGESTALYEFLKMYRSHKSKVVTALEVVVGDTAAKHIVNVAERLPVVEMQCKVQQGDDQSVVIVADLVRRHGKSPQRTAPRSQTPLYPKLKEEGWWLVACDVNNDELLAVKRVSFGQRTSVKLVVPKQSSGGHRNIDVRLVSDCYIGLDQCISL